MRYQGQLVEWHDDKGYGFIQPLQGRQGEQRIFLHIKAFAKRGPRPLTGAWLEYEVALDSKGRLNAQQVSYIRPKQRLSATTFRQTSGVKPGYRWLIRIYLVFIVACSMTGQLPAWAVAVPLLLSMVTYLMYKQDKQAAQQGLRRIPENNLHMLALLGGWPGALLAQQQLRHKSAKQEFLQMFRATVIINWLLLLAILFLLPQGL